MDSSISVRAVKKRKKCVLRLEMQRSTGSVVVNAFASECEEAGQSQEIHSYSQLQGNCWSGKAQVTHGVAEVRSEAKSSRQRAASAAWTSASFLLLPLPRPSSMPCQLTAASKVLA